MAEKLYDKLKRREKRLKEDRHHMIEHWRVLRDYVNPLRGRFGESLTFTQKRPYFDKMITGRSMFARRTLASGMQSGLTSPSRDWFKLTVSDPNAVSLSVRAWLDTVHDRMMRVLSASNYYEEMHQAYDELATFGNAALMIEFDFYNVIRCKTLTAGTYCAALDSRGMVNTVYIERWFSTEQVMEEFKNDNPVPKTIREASNRGEHDRRWKIYNAIEADPKSTNNRYRSIWYCDEDGGTILREGHFDTFPMMFARWSAIPDMVYGYGPGTETLGDIIQLMRMQQDRLTGIAKQVAPPLLVSSALQGQHIYGGPNAVTYAPSEGQIDKMVTSLYQVPLNMNDLQIGISEVVQSIDQGFYVDLFLMLASQDNPQMTATEVAERQTEKMTALGPVLERLEGELLTPSLMRVYTIMQDAGLIPDPPEELIDSAERIKIEYMSILAQAQKMSAIPALQQFVGFLGQNLRAFPELADKVNTDRIVDRYHEYVGAPADILREQEEVDALRQQRAQQAQQAQQMEQMAQMAPAMKQAAQGADLLAETSVMGTPALDSLLGGITGGGGMGI